MREWEKNLIEIYYLGKYFVLGSVVLYAFTANNLGCYEQLFELNCGNWMVMVMKY